MRNKNVSHVVELFRKFRSDAFPSSQALIKVGMVEGSLTSCPNLNPIWGWVGNPGQSESVWQRHRVRDHIPAFGMWHGKKTINSQLCEMAGICCSVRNWLWKIYWFWFTFVIHHGVFFLQVLTAQDQWLVKKFRGHLHCCSEAGKYSQSPGFLQEQEQTAFIWIS